MLSLPARRARVNVAFLQVAGSSLAAGKGGPSMVDGRAKVVAGSLESVVSVMMSVMKE